MADLAFSHGGNIYDAKGKCGEEVIDFSANINPLGLPTEVRKTLRRDLDRTLHYPDPEAKELTQKIAKYWGIKSENILLGNGSVELIYLVMSAYKPETVIIPAPTFSEYERAARSAGSRVRFLKLKEKESFRLDLSEISAADVLFLCNPNNPTGNLLLENVPCNGKACFASQASPACRMAGRSVTTIIDEAFMDFLPDEKNHTLIWKSVRNRNTIVLRTFTKFFALPGLRIGYAVAHKDTIKRLKQHQAPWSTNSMAQMAAKLILDDEEYVKKTRALIEKERSFLSAELAKIGWLRPHSSVANFLLIKIETAGITSKFLTEELLKKRILIRDCSNFRNLDDRYVRTAVRSHKENVQLLTVLREVL
jgi:threonine-phosphate decarboxylase